MTDRRPLSVVAAPILRQGGGLTEDERDTPITGITAHSAAVEPGMLFVALRGTRTDGHAFIPDAVRSGAAAVVAESDFEGSPGVPVVRVANTRRAIAELAAAWHGRPADRLRLVGITGSVGKTSTLSMLEAILSRAGSAAGAVGSLGVHADGRPLNETGHTAPGPLLLHSELARLVRQGCELAAMEVTSHALVQERVHGLPFDIGVFTNLVPLEHSEYHATFRDYVEAKRRFFDYLRPCAPLIYNADSQVVRRLVHASEAEPVGCGTAPAAMVRVKALSISTEGSRLELDVRRPLPRLDGGEVSRTSFPLDLRLLGSSNVSNAALAATTALCLGIDPIIIRRALAEFDPPPRRMQIIHDGRFLVLDDTVGHPDSISALFDVVEKLEPRRVHAVFAVRGQRGARVNRQSAETLAIWSARVPLATLVLTRSSEAADAANRVDDEEYEAFRQTVREHALPLSERERLDEAVREALERAGDGDLVLLLGAQGMNAGQGIAREWLAAQGRPGATQAQA